MPSEQTCYTWLAILIAVCIVVMLMSGCSTLPPPSYPPHYDDPLIITAATAPPAFVAIERTADPVLGLRFIATPQVRWINALRGDDPAQQWEPYPVIRHDDGTFSALSPTSQTMQFRGVCANGSTD